jgi:2-dehydro-3-deoxyphosphogluconate aldolase/(4S)-4-hydroxy-2-oxoglutarate aldolase
MAAQLEGIMDKQAVLDRLKHVGVVPVVRGESADHAVRAVEALMEGGIPLVEITMTVPGAIRAIERCVAHFGDRLIVGVGSVTSAGMGRRQRLRGHPRCQAGGD